MRMSPTVLACFTVVVILAVPVPARALCMRGAMEGRWENADPNGLLKQIDLRFKCCEPVGCPAGQPCTPHCDPPNDTVRVHSPCLAASCDWGSVVPSYVFVDAVNGQVTRVDARYVINGETRQLVILLLPDDRLLVHWSVDYPDASSQRDFSLVEYFERVRCVTFGGREFCAVRPALRVINPPSPTP